MVYWSPSHHHFYWWFINQFPVMGGKHGIVLTTLVWYNTMNTSSCWSKLLSRNSEFHFFITQLIPNYSSKNPGFYSTPKLGIGLKSWVPFNDVKPNVVPPFTKSLSWWTWLQCHYGLWYLYIYICITIVYSIHGVYKPSYNWGAPLAVGWERSHRPRRVCVPHRLPSDSALW